MFSGVCGGKGLETPHGTVVIWAEKGIQAQGDCGRRLVNRTGLSVAFKYHRRTQVFLCVWLAVDMGRASG